MCDLPQRYVASTKGSGVISRKRRETVAFMGEAVRPVRRYFSKEAKSKLVREVKALEEDEGEQSTARKAYRRDPSLEFKAALSPRDAQVSNPDVSLSIRRVATVACYRVAHDVLEKIQVCIDRYCGRTCQGSKGRVCMEID